MVRYILEKWGTKKDKDKGSISVKKESCMREGIRIMVKMGKE